MRKNSFCLCLGALALSTLLLASCEKEKTETIFAPSLSLSPTAVVASADGGSYSFSCKISNPAEDGEITASPADSWIENLTATTPGTGYSFTISANPGDTRTGRISVSYVSSYGTLTETMTIVQNGGSAPTLTVQPMTVTAAAGGGTYSFNYSVSNPGSDDEISCIAGADWISGINLGKKGTVIFTVTSNTTSSLRQSDITLFYSSSYGTLEQTVTVIQDHASGSDGGSGGGDVSDLIGTYTARGLAYADAGVVKDTTWTLTIYESNVSGFDVFIDGLVPTSVGLYPGTEAYIAQAQLNAKGQLVIPSQLTGYSNPSTGFYIGWTPCVAYDEDNGWSYSSTLPSTTLTFDSSTGTWTSDYGEFLGLFTVTANYQIDKFQGFFDVVNPGITLTKTSSSTSTTSLTDVGVVSHPIDEHLVLHKDHLFAK